MVEAGASDKEIKKAISDAILVRDSAKEIIESHGLKKLGITKDIHDPGYIKKTTRSKELVSVAAAFAVNCTTNLEKHLAASRAIGLTENEIESILDAALFIKGEAAHYVDQIAKLEQKYDQLEQLHKELQETQAQLVQSEKMAALGKLVAGVVHEMNTPIGAINSAADISARSISNILEGLKTCQNPDEIRNDRKLKGSIKALQNSVPITLSASERITKIVNSLKSFARLDESPFQKVCLHESLENTLILIENDLKDRINVKKEYGNIPLVACYPSELNQVFINLLTNAVQAIKDKGTITIQTNAENEHVIIQIADTGIGIPQEQIEGLFEPNFTKKGNRVKAGLGLFTSYNIIQKHRGQITVESEVGKGSTFTVVLPINLETEPAEVESDKSCSQTSRCDRLKT